MLNETALKMNVVVDVVVWIGSNWGGGWRERGFGGQCDNEKSTPTQLPGLWGWEQPAYDASRGIAHGISRHWIVAAKLGSYVRVCVCKIGGRRGERERERERELFVDLTKSEIPIRLKSIKTVIDISWRMRIKLNSRYHPLRRVGCLFKRCN